MIEPFDVLEEFGSDLVSGAITWLIPSLAWEQREKAFPGGIIQTNGLFPSIDWYSPEKVDGLVKSQDFEF